MAQFSRYAINTVQLFNQIKDDIYSRCAKMSEIKEDKRKLVS